MGATLTIGSAAVSKCFLAKLRCLNTTAKGRLSCGICKQTFCMFCTRSCHLFETKACRLSKSCVHTSPKKSSKCHGSVTAILRACAESPSKSTMFGNSSSAAASKRARRSLLAPSAARTRVCLRMCPFNRRSVANG